MATYFNIDGYNSYSGCDAIVTAQLANIDEDSSISKNCYILGSLQTLSTSTHQDKVPVRNIGNINAVEYTMGQRTIAGSMVFAVFDRHFADEIFNDLKEYTNDTVILADEIPALNLTITLANEYGSRSRMALYGVKFVDEGQVLSINDLYTENTFQFVAVGMDPLTAEKTEWAKSTSKPKKNKTYISKDNTPFPSYDGKSYPGSSGKPSGGGGKPQGPSDTNKYQPDDDGKKEPYYRINQPLAPGNKGIISVDLNNHPDVTVTITDINTNKSYNSVGANLSNNIWYVELSEGNYNIKFFDRKNNKELGSEYFSVNSKLGNLESSNNDYPIIVNMTHNSAEIEANNSRHDEAVLIDRTNQIVYDHIPLAKSTVTLNEESIGANLISGNVYELYTINSKEGYSSKSKSIMFSPLERQDYDVELLEGYVKSNKKLWVNNLDEFDYHALYNNEDDNNLIDKVLNTPTTTTRMARNFATYAAAPINRATSTDKEAIKQEVLLYAIKLQNQLALIYNNAIAENSIYNSNILNLDIQINDAINRINLYKIKGHKAYYMYSVKEQDEMKFYGTPNVRYYLQPIFNQCKGISYNYCCFNNDTKENLDVYGDINNLYAYDFNNYKTKYAKYSKDFLYALIARDNFYSDKYMIDGPYCYYENNILYADIDYSETLQKGNYYLCIASIYEVLDHTPIRKYKFSTDDKHLELDNYKTSITKDNYYLTWIEDDEFNSICKPTILCTYEDNSDLVDFESSLIKNYLKSRIDSIKARYSYSGVLESIYLSLISETLSFKNTMYRLQQEFISQFDESSYFLYLDEIFYDLIRQDYESYSLVCNAQQKNKVFNFSSNMDDTHLVLIDYKIGEDLPTKSTLYDTNTVDLTDRNSNYTLIYMIDKTMVYRSGFLLINNVTNKVYNYNMSLEVIK